MLKRRYQMLAVAVVAGVMGVLELTGQDVPILYWKLGWVVIGGMVLGFVADATVIKYTEEDREWRLVVIAALASIASLVASGTAILLLGFNAQGCAWGSIWGSSTFLAAFLPYLRRK